MYHKRIERFQYLSQDDIADADHIQLIKEACRQGVKWIQLRIKNISGIKLLDIASDIREICKSYHTRLIINDYVDIAKEVKADGVHLGKHDMDIVQARQILGKEFIIGGTCNSFKDISELSKKGVDYIGLGPFNYTNSKQNLSPVLGLEGIRDILTECKEAKINIPVIVIGGICQSDVESIINCGAYGVAVSGAINHASNRTEAFKSFLSFF
jgi:thiamine-phosphate pyrophosphorylase